MDEKKIRSYINAILNEQDEQAQAPVEKQKSKKSSKAISAGEIGLSVGRGGFTKVVADTGALAKKNPGQLMKNLGIKAKGNGLQGVIDIWKQASTATEPMSQAFGGMNIITKGTRKGVVVGLGQLNARNGAKFAHHTLKGAMAAGFLTSNVPLQIQVVGDEIVIHTGENKGDWE